MTAYASNIHRFHSIKNILIRHKRTKSHLVRHFSLRFLCNFFLHDLIESNQFLTISPSSRKEEVQIQIQLIFDNQKGEKRENHRTKGALLNVDSSTQQKKCHTEFSSWSRFHSAEKRQVVTIFDEVKQYLP